MLVLGALLAVLIGAIIRLTGERARTEFRHLVHAIERRVEGTGRHTHVYVTELKEVTRCAN